jgi:RNA polymerase sigma-70 factor (ECF subfamily)
MGELYQHCATEYGPALERLARAYEVDAGRREDLLQEIHSALWRSLRTFDGRCSLRTWVYRVAHNTAVTHIRGAVREGWSASTKRLPCPSLQTPTELCSSSA